MMLLRIAPRSPSASCCNSPALSSQSVSFVVCDYFDSVFYGLLRPRYARICFATPVETKVAPRWEGTIIAG